jgi:hypothetical protein
MRFSGLRGGSATNALARSRAGGGEDDDCGGGFDFSRFAFRARLGEREGSRAERRRMSDS